MVATEITWFNVQDWGVEGKNWHDTERYYNRLPARAKGLVTEKLWNLSRHSAGMCVHFETNANAIHARWTLSFEELAMPHMAATSVSGVDLYAQDDQGQWRWVAVGKPSSFPQIEQQLVAGLRPGKRVYRLYLPLYNEVTAVEVGVDVGAMFKPIQPRTEKPIVFYGSSIVQGGCASRPGMPHPAIIGRHLNKPIINMGFSGSAKMEPEVATLLAELDPCIFVIDAIPNMNAEMVCERADPFIRILRAAHKVTPIVIVEDRTVQNAPFLQQREADHAAARLALRQTYERLTDAGIPNLHYIEGQYLLGDDYEASVDGSHPTDAGFLRISQVLEPKLQELA